jgi:hypothetical protein
LGCSNHDADPDGEGNDNDNERRYPWIVNRQDAYGRFSSHANFDPTSLLIPNEALSQMKALERQFWEVKRRNMDVVLFVQVTTIWDMPAKNYVYEN